MRLIDADALEELFRETIGHIAKRPEIDGALEHMVRASAMAVEMIRDAQTVDAVPNPDGRWLVHGRWEPSEKYFGYNKCSVCADCYIDREWAMNGKWHYCPNCGAKMDGGDWDGAEGHC